MPFSRKILFLIQLPPPVHGASVVNRSIQESLLIKSAFETQYVDISPAHDMDDIGKFSLLKAWLTLRIYFRSVLKHIRFKPHLVYMTLSPHGLAFYKDGLLALALKLFGAKMVFHMHGKGIDAEAKKNRLKKYIYRLVFSKVDIIHLAPSLFYDVETVRDHTKKIFAVPNSSPTPPKMIIKKDDDIVTFIYLSNLVRTKGADILVRAASLLPSELQDKFKVKIVGKPANQQYTDEIIQLLSQNPYGNIELLGPKYGEDKYKELLSSHIFVLPTQNECFPLSILEAMSCGLAVISTQEGAIPDIIESGIMGDILSECTPEALAAVMTKHIESRAHTVLRAKVSKDKFETHYTHKVFEKNLICVLQELSN